jgi:hypothetical protein
MDLETGMTHRSDSALRTLQLLLARVVTALAAVATALLLMPLPAAAQSYTWRNVEIVGGGYVPGIIFNTSERDLIYARTDIGASRPLGSRLNLMLFVRNLFDRDNFYPSSGGARGGIPDLARTLSAEVRFAL